MLFKTTCSSEDEEDSSLEDCSLLLSGVTIDSLWEMDSDSLEVSDWEEEIFSLLLSLKEVIEDSLEKLEDSSLDPFLTIVQALSNIAASNGK